MLVVGFTVIGIKLTDVTSLALYTTQLTVFI